MNIVLTGGGTAGHITPNLALIDDLKKYFDKVYYFGNKNGMEYKLTKNYDIRFIHCDSIKFNRQKLFKNLLIPFILPSCIAKAKRILKYNHINIVFSKGGYVGLPVSIAAKMLKIPVVCHESDLTLGLANKVTSIFADAVITSHKETAKKKKFVYIGTPLRKEIFNANPEIVYEKFGIPNHQPILLIVGGSLGAKAINETVYNSLDSLCTTFFVIHICGKNYKKIQHKNYAQLDFVSDIENYISAASIIVSRCGATLSAEITALNKKVLYIPLENSASRGDQVDNADYLEKQNLSLTLSQKKLSTNTLIEHINKVLNMNKTLYNYDSLIPIKITSLLVKVAKK